MPVLENDLVRVELDERWPRIVSLTRRQTGGTLRGCRQSRRFAIELNGERHEQEVLTPGLTTSERAADYALAVPALDLRLHFRFALEGEVLILSLADVHEAGEFRLERFCVPDHRLVTGRAEAGDSYHRHVTRRKNWSWHWCPGAWDGSWEDRGPVADGVPEDLGPQKTQHAAVWNEGICAAFACSVYVDPLVTVLDAEGQLRPGRAGRFSVRAGECAYRLRGEPARPFELRIGVLGDYDGNGRVDWCDAANWEGDQAGVTDYDLYPETILYKLYLDDMRREAPLRTFDDALEEIELIHEVSGGARQVCYLVGWQEGGHDASYPCHTRFNERAGGLDGLRRLIGEARRLNCTVSLHVNLDDSYEEFPEFREDLLSREDGRRFVWFHNRIVRGKDVYSINHTLAVESGYEEDRLERLLELVPLQDSVHADAHRPYNEAWLPDGEHVGAECEVQRGLIPIFEMYREHGLDITTEGICATRYPLYTWGWHMVDWRNAYETVMSHGRVSAYNRRGKEGAALGMTYVCDELNVNSFGGVTRSFYQHWMYAHLLHRKAMTGYRIGAWNQGVEAQYEDDTWVRSGFGGSPTAIEAVYEGIPVARGEDRFLPWREDTIYAYSPEGGPKEWTLPAAWEGAEVEAATLRRGGEAPGPELEAEGRTVRFTAPAGLAVRLTRSGHSGTDEGSAR